MITVFNMLMVMKKDYHFISDFGHTYLTKSGADDQLLAID